MLEKYGEFANLLRLFRNHWKRIVFRAHKDKRSLQALLVLIGVLLYAAYDGFLLLRNPVSFIMLGIGLIVAWRIRKANDAEDASVFRLSNYESPSVTPNVVSVERLSSEMMKLWLLIWRASSESFLGKYTIPEGREVVSRRAVLDTLQSLGLRGSLSRPELDLHLLPDGAWSKEAIVETLLRVPELEALQYSCGAIGALSPIEDFDRIRTAEIDPMRRATEYTSWKPHETVDIRHEMNMAALFYLRCFGEQVRRGLLTKDFDEEANEILSVATADAGDPNRDMLIGTKIVSEVENDKLSLAAAQSYLRFRALGHALSVLESSS